MPVEKLFQVVPQKSFQDLYKLGPRRGEGGFGVVLEATRLSDSKILAVKVLKKAPTESDVNECLFMSKINDTFTLSAIDYFINSDIKSYNQLVIITEIAI